MTPEEACKILNISKNASEEERLEAFANLQEELQRKFEEAETPTLRKTYRKSLRELEEANMVLENGEGMGVELSGEDPSIDEVSGTLDVRAQLLDELKDELKPDSSDSKSDIQSGGIQLPALQKKQPGKGRKTDTSNLPAGAFPHASEKPGRKKRGRGKKTKGKGKAKKPLTKKQLAMIAGGAFVLLVILGLTGVGGYWVYQQDVKKREAARVEEEKKKKEAEAKKAEEERLEKERIAAEKKKEQDRIAALRGGFQITSRPEGATVRLYNEKKEYTGTTPLFLEKVELGEYQVQLSLELYDSVAAQKVVIKEDKVTKLKPVIFVRSKGNLEMSIDPETKTGVYNLKKISTGKDKHLDEEVSLRGNFPDTVTDLPTGKYEIHYKGTGWKMNGFTEVKASETTVYRPEFKYGIIEMETRPEGASVYLKPKGAGVVIGQKSLGTTPCTITDVNPGETTYTIKLDGYRPMDITATVSPGQTLKFSKTLSRLTGPIIGKNYVSSSGIEMIWVKPGKFVMGSSNNEKGRFRDEGPQTPVELSKGFWMSKHEVNQSQFEKVSGYNPSKFQGGKLPVESVNWSQAVDFCRELAKQDGRVEKITEGYFYRLPYEAEWEYVCRAGTSTPYAGTSLEAVGWFEGNSGKRTHPIGSKSPNAWGFYDMHGNVWEWCLDFYEDRYPGVRVTDWKGPSRGSLHVFRGGSWKDSAEKCRSAKRLSFGRRGSFDYLGFRIVSAPKEK